MTDRTPLVWTCTTCGFPIATTQPAVLGVPFSELSAWPRVAPTWRAQHTACIDPANDVYGIDLETASTVAGILRWTAHVVEKPWIHDSNWADILRHVDDSIRAGADA